MCVAVKMRVRNSKNLLWQNNMCVCVCVCELSCCDRNPFHSILFSHPLARSFTLVPRCEFRWIHLQICLRHCAAVLSSFQIIYSKTVWNRSVRSFIQFVSCWIKIYTSYIKLKKRRCERIIYATTERFYFARAQTHTHKCFWYSTIKHFKLNATNYN